MEKKEIKNIFFDVDTILQKDKLMNMVYGARGLGKTYSALKKAYNNFLKTKMSTIYLRRYKSEIRKFETILNPLIKNGEIDANKIVYENKNGQRYIDKETSKTIIEAVPLSKAVTYKSASYDTTNFIIFDEFILDKSSLHYIPDEFELFNNFIETIARLGELDGRVVKILMLANSGSRNNPYFMGYNIPIYKGDTYIKDDLIIYKPSMETFKEVKSQTRWGRFILNNTKMSDYMIEGNFKDKNDFIQSLPNKTQYIATLIYMSQHLGVYLDKTETNNLFISDKYNKDYKIIYSLTNEDNTPNILILDKDNRLFQMLKSHWKYGYLRFTDLKIQAIFIDILKIL